MNGLELTKSQKKIAWQVIEKGLQKEYVDGIMKLENECEDFSEEMRLPVVNSPRMGICGYEGGMIDKERDGV